MDNYTYGLFEKAKKNHDLYQMKKLHEDNKDDYEIKFEYAKLLSRNKKYNEANDIFISLLNTPIKRCAILELGKVSLKQGNVEKARICFQTLLKAGLSQDKQYAKLELAKLEFEQGNIEVARGYCEDLLNGSLRDKMYAEFELGRIEVSQGNINEARNRFEKLLKTNFKDKGYIMFELAKIEFRLGNIDKAESYYKDLLNRNPRDKGYALLGLGNIEFIKGNIEKAKNYFIRLLDVSYQDRIYALTCLVKLFIKQNDYINAFNYLMDLRKCELPFEFKSEFELLKLYIMVNLNIFFKDVNKIKLNYNNSQFLDYDELVAIEHIIDRHKDDFSSDIDIYRLYNDIRSNLIEEYKVRKLGINDIYDIPYENIGKNCHILRVVTLPNSKDILTMFPLDDKNFDLDVDADEENNLILQRKR